jgi:hypothetical protein
MGSPKGQLLTAATVTVLCGSLLLGLGLSAGGGVGLLLVVCSVAVLVLSTVIAITALRQFGPDRRLPEHLRDQPHLAPTDPQPYTLVLSDGRTITGLAVFRGGYLRPRPTDPPFDAREVVNVALSSEEELVAEDERQRSH